MTQPEDQTLHATPSRPEPAPEKIGPYTIKRRIASGGMGIVYEGVQENPRRSVAVKVMRRGVVSMEAQRRFEYESQLLARLRHPGIAQVYEAGTHGEGEDALPYFAMEYIPNAKSLIQFAADKRLTSSERLDLFARICDAVHHGHQKGIVHRDLKPSNILVDSQGNPRIIDFGVARATDSDIALATVRTEVGQLIGSVQYMSPEQFEADPSDIDIRSDVYTLGVILYELLRDELPYDLGKTSIYEASRVVREDDPPRLSSGRPDLKGDVETIVNKAMEKNRDRRFQSAFGLAQDIRRYLNGETITARPPSVAYQVRVFARRNKALMGAVAAVFVVLVAGVAASTTLFLHAKKQREVAETQTAKAEATSAFLQDMIQEAIPSGWGEDPPTIQELLDLTRDRTPEAFADEPETEAEVCQTLGWGYLSLTNPEEAYRQLSRAFELRKNFLGEAHPATMQSMVDLATISSITGRFSDESSIRKRIVELHTEELGPEHETTLLSVYRLAVTLAEAGNLGEAGRQAATLSETCHRILGEEAELTLSTDTFLAGLDLMRGEFATAETQSRQIIDRARKAFGNEHDITRSARSQLAATLVSQGESRAAAELYNNRSLPRELGILAGFQGELTPKDSGTQVLVFWEAWCPFSQRAVPKLEDYYQRYRSQDLEVVGITTVSRSATDDTVLDFIASRNLTFPVVKSDGRLNRYFQQPGTPFVAILKDGLMVWENYLDTPESIPSVMFEGLVSRNSGSK